MATLKLSISARKTRGLADKETISKIANAKVILADTSTELVAKKKPEKPKPFSYPVDKSMESIAGKVSLMTVSDAVLRFQEVSLVLAEIKSYMFLYSQGIRNFKNIVDSGYSQDVWLRSASHAQLHLSYERKLLTKKIMQKP